MFDWLGNHWFEVAVVGLLTVDTFFVWGLSVRYGDPDLPWLRASLDRIETILRDIERRLSAR